jgi:hypothetical protein
MAKYNLSDIEALKGLEKAREDTSGIRGLQTPMGRLGQPGSKALQLRESILDKAIAKFTYAVENLDQETKQEVISLFNDKLKLGYSTTMSGLKQDALDKIGLVPIDKETIYNAIINLDLPKELELEIEALGNMADAKDLSFSLANNNLGITYDSESDEIRGEYNFENKDGNLFIKPVIEKDADSKVTKSIEIDRAIKDGKIGLDVTDTDDSTFLDLEAVKGGSVLNLQKNIGKDNFLSGEFTSDLPIYSIDAIEGDQKFSLSPSFSADFYKDNDFTGYGAGIDFPITKNLSTGIFTQKAGDGTSVDSLGINYQKPVFNDGIFSIDAGIDTDRNKNIGFNLTIPFGKGGEEIQSDPTVLMSSAEKNAYLQELEQKKYLDNLIYGGNDAKELMAAAAQNFDLKDLIGPIQPKEQNAEGGLNYLMGM